MLLAHIKKHPWWASLFLMGFMYLYGVLSPSHYGMVENDFNSSLVLSAMTAVAVLFGLYCVNIERVGISTLTWVGLLVVISIQPIVNNITYVDALIFPAGLFLLSTLLSLVAVNLALSERKNIIWWTAWLFLLVSLFSVATQLFQLFYPNVFGFIAPFVGRLYANLSQPNQASFVNVLGASSGFYLYYLYHKSVTSHRILVVFLIASLLILSIGISLSLSRAGILMLGAAIFGAIFYPWLSNKYRALFVMGAIVFSIIGYQIGVWLMQAFLMDYQGVSGVDRLVAEGTNLRVILLERALSAFLSSPIFGIGYDNYLAYGLTQIDQVAWFEPADHAHNVIAQIAAELGLVGLVAIIGVSWVLCRQFVRFIVGRLPSHELFICLMILIFVLYSFSEFPLWMPLFLMPFVFFVGLMDEGVEVNLPRIKSFLIIMALLLSCVSVIYVYLYHHNLKKHAIVVYAEVDNQQKIDAYRAFPDIFGLRQTKEYMLHKIVDDEKTDNIDKYIELGDRVMRAHASMDVARVQMVLFIKAGRREEAELLGRRLCVWEHQQRQTCDIAAENILKIDPTDSQGYAQRLKDWYVDWLETKPKLS